jgi:phosphoserine aminotransferase
MALITAQPQSALFMNSIWMIDPLLRYIVFVRIALVRQNHRYSMIFAGAQKNLGPAGMTVVILDSNMLRLHAAKAHKHAIPTMLDYKIMVDSKSMYNTPPTYPIYMAGLVLEWFVFWF